MQPDAFNNLPLPAFALDPDLHICIWNKAMAEVTGKSDKEANGDSLMSIMANIAEGGKAQAKELAACVLHLEDRKSGHDARFDQVIRFKKDTAKAFRLSASRCAVSEKPGSACYTLVFIPDDAAENAREEEIITRIRSLMPGMVYQILNDGQWTISYVSDGAKELTGRPSEYFLNHPSSTLQALMHPDDVPRVLENFYRAVTNHGSFVQEYRLIGLDGTEKWVQDRGLSVFSETDELKAIEGFISEIRQPEKKEDATGAGFKERQPALAKRRGLGEIVGSSPAMKKVASMIARAAAATDSVFILGETGTGKELVAHAIHEQSARRAGPFIAVNCGAIPEGLVESAFFGHKKGAFTTATHNQMGYLQAAHRGTLFLDEIGEISLSMQIKLLRALEEGGFSPVGGHEVIKPDVRVVAASNKDLRQLLNDGQIRRDFFYRIYIMPVHLPPLREREGDIELLADKFLKAYSGQTPPPSFSAAEMTMLRRYPWPGNVRELQNVVRRYLAEGEMDFLKELDEGCRGQPERQPDAAGINLSDAVNSCEEGILRQALEKTKWNKVKAAELLGISRRTLFRKLKQFGME